MDLNRQDERALYVREMFTRIAHRYDLMNRLMTAGQDQSWRRKAIARAALPVGGRILDLGAGTGDLALEALRQYPGRAVVAADFTQEMMRIGRSRFNQRRPFAAGPLWTAADAYCLPFAGESYEAVVSGFLLRNVADIHQALAEQVRVLKPGGRWIALDTTQPRRSLLSPFVRLHLQFGIPILGRLLTGQPDAYRYLPETTQRFLAAEQLAARMADVGLKQIGFQLFMLGTVAIHWGIK